MTAVALYDYQAAAEDEISFDPNDIITNIEMVSYEVSSVVNLRPQELHVKLSSQCPLRPVTCLSVLVPG